MGHFWDDLRYVLEHVGFDQPAQDNGGMPMRSRRLEQAVRDLTDTANRQGEPIYLSLTPLREANAARQAEWHGGEKVDLAFRGLELAGEVGELANKLKKLVRLDRGIHGTSEAREALLADIRDEAGDVLVCLDLVAMELGIDLGPATREKFNKTSVKQGLQTRMKE